MMAFARYNCVTTISQTPCFAGQTAGDEQN